MPLSETWRDQYERMRRSQQRLVEAAGPSSMGSDEARDRLYHFFQDAFHLKDWLIHDLAMSKDDKDDLEDYVTATDALARCADICNGTKHLKLKTPRIRDTPAELTNQSVKIALGVFETVMEFPGSPAAPPAPPRVETTAEHQWFVTFDGQQYDAVQLASEVVTEWEKWLNDKGLLP